MKIPFSAQKIFSAIFPLAIVTFCLTGCKVEGTGTGNPMQGTPAMGTTNSVTDAIAYTTCSITARCHQGAVYLDCLGAIAKFTTYADKLGVRRTPAPSVYELRELEINKKVLANGKVSGKCIEQANALACSSPEVSQAFDPHAESPYAGTVHLLRPVCQGVFREAPELISDDESQL